MMKHFYYTAVILLVATSSAESISRADQNSNSPAISLGDVTLTGDLGKFSKQLKTQQLEKGLQLVTLRLVADEPSELKPLTLKFNFPSVDINGYWNSQQSLDKVNYYRSSITSGASGAAPVLCFYSNRLQNRITFALSDALNTVKISCGVKEEDVHFYASMQLFTVKMPPTKEYEVQLRIDTRDLPYYEALDETRLWWEQMPEYQSAPVPDIARRPMYSTWYSYHQNLEADRIVEECRLARELGCYAVIVDDGWQTTDSNRGYAYTGDWKPERLAKMREFVDRVHAEGMQVVLWYSLPFMGEKAANFERFQGKYLYHWKSVGAHVLDPRYPEVREYMIDTYEKALTDWNLDGFKLDFIGWFKAYGDTKLTIADGRDFASVAAATDHLMTEITQRLRKKNPNVLLEFRQPYVGPVMRKYGNMFRGVDCPNNAAANRNEIANLRILSGDTAVHSDMFIWREEEPTESAALQILNILFSVPQISVRLANISPEHREMVRYWLGYWNENRQILLDGMFIPSNPGANYPSLTAFNGSKQIVALYETNVAEQMSEDVKEVDVINASGKQVVYVDMLTDWSNCSISIFDCRGRLVKQQNTSLLSGVHRFEVPLSGILSIQVNENK